ncbi:DUF6427 family protein [Flagellimonas nanhaiensis]|uniref:Beta-carotene 15,15'-monooxygenase n=1 Tax=Flagellimonas nanhaiensis TaxID=2292706 RepID=A0A371JQQ8_9FLAO|nr:DUF6427 family protein [Allomuricauda nanhaiensis]RDY59839.1 hypothetical protein DX873_10830 [Allomuricauda nanhaiensis]
MFSSFFGKTKPINYIVLSVFLFLFYLLDLLFQVDGKIGEVDIAVELMAFVALLLSIFVINQIVRTEKVTDFNSYAMLFFVLLIVAFSDVLMDKKAIFANLFLLIAVWRLLAIKSIRNVKHKVFDGAFLITVASLFYDWALIFMILVFVVINVYDRKTFKNWLVPFLAMITVFILSFTVLKLLNALSFYKEHYRFTFDFLNDGFFTRPDIIKFLIYASLIFVVVFFVFLRTRKIGGGKLIVLRLVFLAFIFATTITLFKSGNASPVLLTFFPASVFLANYLEGIKRAKLQELVTGLCLGISLLLFLLELNL